MIAYLSGGMENAPKEGSDWRNEMTGWLIDNLQHTVIDPVVESGKIIKDHDGGDYRDWKNSNPNKYKEFTRLLINRDLRAVVAESDYLICLWDESVLKGGGTHGEVTIAYFIGKPVYLVNHLPMKDLSGWIFSCATETLNSFDALKKALLKRYK